MGISAPTQLSLGVSLRDDATFGNFYTSEGVNAQAIDALQKLAEGDKQNIMIWGGRGSGLTHLLQAVCHDAYSAGQSIQYLPLRDMLGYSAEDICEGLEDVTLVCIDGVDRICGNRTWEIALFNLFNNIRDAGNSLLIASNTSPPSLPLLLPDLKSRLLSSTVYHIQSLKDDEKGAAMMMRAAARGMELPVEVAKYILGRASRDTSTLFDLLDRLDDASLQHQRKLTIPFVKEIIGDGQPA